MPLVVAFTAPETVEIVEEEERPLGPDEARVRTLFSGISAGTEMSAYRGTNPYLNKRWDAERRLFIADSAHAQIEYPVTGWGYEEAGSVVEIGSNVSGLAPSTMVYGSWGHRSSAVLEAAYLRERILPEQLDPILGIFSHIGATALNGVLDASIRLGETVAVFGLGVVGQLVAQMARLSGARVIGIDLLPMRRRVAQALGAHIVLDAGEGETAEYIKDLTEGRGADVCIEASGSYRALNEAIRACAYSSRVVALGFYQGAGQSLLLGEEMHHNRVTIVTSQIGGIAPDLQHRWDRLRLVRTVMRLAATGDLQLHPLIMVRPVTQAAELFRLVSEHPEQVLQAVLDFRSL